MRFIFLVFLLTFTLNGAAQSPVVSRLFSDGTQHANAGHFDEALKSYKTALFASENEHLQSGYRAQLHYNIGVCYFRLDRFDPASDHFKQAILLNKQYVRAHYALGMVQSRKRAWRAAAVSLTKVVELEPTNGEAWFDLAFASVVLKDFPTAETAFAKSIAFESIDSALSHNNIGVILAINGDLAAAETRFANAISMSDGTLREAKRNLEYCRAKRSGGRDLIASELEYARRGVSLRMG